MHLPNIDEIRSKVLINRFFYSTGSYTLSDLEILLTNHAKRNKHRLDGATISLLENINIDGCHDVMISGAASLENANHDDIAFLTDSRYRNMLRETSAGICVLTERNKQYAPQHAGLLVTSDPMRIQAILLELLYEDLCVLAKQKNIASKSICSSVEIDPSAVVSINACIGANSVVLSGARIARGVFIGSNVVIGNNCYIGSHAYIDDYVHIDDGTYIHEGAYVGYADVGKACEIGRGARIGSEGFGFPLMGALIYKMPQVGQVKIGNNVRLGANTCVDRGSVGVTYIGDNTKIDNLVQIGHNAIIGKNCLIAAQTGIAGSTKIGDYCMIGGQVGIAGHLKIGNGVMIAAQSGVMTNLKDSARVGGSPALPAYLWHKINVHLKNLVGSRD